MLLPLLLSCAQSPSNYHPELLCADPSGVWDGLWHGMIIEFSFLFSLFNDSIVIYDPCNSGGWYDFGFLCGAILAFSGTTSATK